jgi:hypothetical protein
VPNTGVLQTIPGLIPGPRTIMGTRIPPSRRDPLPPEMPPRRAVLFELSDVGALGADVGVRRPQVAVRRCRVWLRGGSR